LNIADLNTPDSLTSSTLKLVVPMILIAALFQLADGAQIIFTANLRGLNDTKIPALYGLICFWGIGIGSGIFLSRYLDLGPVWVWAGLAIGLSVNAMMLLIRWYRCLKAIKEGSRSLLETEVR